MVMNVLYTLMNEAMRMVQRIGGKITGMNVHGGDLAAAKAAPDRKKVRRKADQG